MWLSSLSKHQMASYPCVAGVPEALEVLGGLQWEAPAGVSEGWGRSRGASQARLDPCHQAGLPGQGCQDQVLGEDLSPPNPQGLLQR